MDINVYISSGILENYVFGTVTDQERQEVECMSHIYPEIKIALTEIQDAIEQMATKAAVPPPETLRAKIMERIKNISQENASTHKETAVIPISDQVKKVKMYRNIVAAASIVLFVGLGMYSYLLQDDLIDTRTALDSTNLSLEQLQAKLEEATEENSEISDQIAFIRDRNTRKVKLGGTEKHPTNLATVFWNYQSEKVLLDVHNLPITSKTESYQLWALIDGQPKDMGVFDLEQDDVSETGLLEMKTTQQADAFAVTLEPKGGSESPTLENLRVIGTI